MDVDLIGAIACYVAAVAVPLLVIAGAVILDRRHDQQVRYEPARREPSAAQLQEMLAIRDHEEAWSRAPGGEPR